MAVAQGLGRVLASCQNSSGGSSRFGLRQPAAAFIPQLAAVVEDAALPPVFEPPDRRSVTPSKLQGGSRQQAGSGKRQQAAAVHVEKPATPMTHSQWMGWRMELISIL